MKVMKKTVQGEHWDSKLKDRPLQFADLEEVQFDGGFATED